MVQWGNMTVQWPRDEYGAPLSRRRIFVIMVRKDVLKPQLKDLESFERHILRLLEGMQLTVQVSWSFG